ncbi:polymer-forming cytoskeletal protein [Vibrio coralliilyticus]|uniref:polymer-forming cytoskeletal protein n=1 Tax=Vibrio coralliilyticus TaxID=190893 RepID=UPI0002DD337D|nr:polymer-forming cytoskeletal protein [Vibrio coralliilyticus]
MKFENGMISGDLTVEEELTLNGMVTGNIVVLDEAKLILNGTCNGSLEIQNGSEVDISGVVQGDINNLGGILRINGVVQGDVSDAGTTVVSEGAEVKGTINKVTQSSSSTLAGMIGGAIVANMLIPGFGAAVVGGVLGALLGSESAKKENSDD